MAPPSHRNPMLYTTITTIHAALVLRVYAAGGSTQSGRELSEARSGSGRWGESGAEEVLWERVIDVRSLMALPAGSKLSLLWTLPADCLLVEMSNGGLYAPGVPLSLKAGKGLQGLERRGGCYLTCNV